MKSLNEIFAENLRGWEYIKARCLTPKPLYPKHCPHCKRIELEGQIARLTKNWKESK